MYVTMRQWKEAEPAQLDGVCLVAVAPGTAREATASWFSRSADTLSLESSLQIVLDRYGRRASPCA